MKHILIIITAVLLMATVSNASDWKDYTTEYDVYILLKSGKINKITPKEAAFTGSIKNIDQCKKVIEVFEQVFEETSTGVNVAFFCLPKKINLDFFDLD